jgi:oligopeptide/dipeptide ABC transporter ATP-binding protein
MSELLRVENLKVHFPVSGGGFQKKFVKAVDGVDFTLEKGEVVALVGESGCGKSTVGKALVSLVQKTDGQVFYEGTDVSDKKSMANLRKNVQYIFQDPYSSLNPRMTVKTILTRPMEVFKLHKDPEEREKRLEELMQQVGLLKEHGLRFPHEFSGGQKQRISIARALAVEPELIIADEPTAALDVSIQAQVLKLLVNLKETLGLTMLFISHDLGVVEYISDRILVMYLGTIVESGPTKDVIARPLHPYTKALLAAVPKNPLQEQDEAFKLEGNIPSPMNIPTGCRLHTRCPYATESCKSWNAELMEVEPGRMVACNRYCK